MSRGRQGDKRHTRTTATVSAASTWMTSAHAPAPAAARTTPTTPPTTAPAISRSCRLRNCISRVSSAFWVAETDVSRTTICVAAFQPMPLTTCCFRLRAAAGGGRSAMLVLVSSSILWLPTVQTEPMEVAGGLNTAGVLDHAASEYARAAEAAGGGASSDYVIAD